MERIEEKLQFHHLFLEQDLAGYLAREYNRRLRGLPSYDKETTPRLEFLQASILLVVDPDWNGGLRGILVEKMLDTTRFPWTKWSDNNGMVDGVRKQIPLDVDYELKQLAQEQSNNKIGGLLEVVEEDEDSEEEDEDSEAYEEPDSGSVDSVASREHPDQRTNDRQPSGRDAIKPPITCMRSPISRYVTLKDKSWFATCKASSIPT